MVECLWDRDFPAWNFCILFLLSRKVTLVCLLHARARYKLQYEFEDVVKSDSLNPPAPLWVAVAEQ
jgi:hypothetical protein